jgi:hypothetical protein
MVDHCCFSNEYKELKDVLPGLMVEGIYRQKGLKNSNFSTNKSRPAGIVSEFQGLDAEDGA